MLPPLRGDVSKVRTFWGCRGTRQTEYVIWNLDAKETYLSIWNGVQPLKRSISAHMNVGHYRNITGAFYTLVFWAYLLKVKSNFDDLGVVGLLVMRATTFLGLWGHFVEKVVEKLGFLRKSCSPEGSKIQSASRKNFVPTRISVWP